MEEIEALEDDEEAQEDFREKIESDFEVPLIALQNSADVWSEDILSGDLSASQKILSSHHSYRDGQFLATGCPPLCARTPWPLCAPRLVRKADRPWAA